MTERAIVRRLDHINIVVPRPRDLFDLLTQEFQIPIERPWARFPAFESGQAMLGIGHEPITYAPGRPTGVPNNAGFFALAFEPESIPSARSELSRRGIPQSMPFEFAVRFPEHAEAFALDEPAGEGWRRRRWTLITIGGMFGDQGSAQELSRWPRRGDAFGAGSLGRLLGRLASGRSGGVLMARLGSVRPFVFLCSFRSFRAADARAVTAHELERRGGGPLGLLRTREVIVTARDLQAERHQWQRFVDPARPDAHGAWSLGDGPALRLIEGREDAIHSVVWEVSSLDQAGRWLQAKGWLEDKVDDGIKIAVEPLQGLDVRLAEPQS